MAKISKAILGLMTVILLAVTMVPFASAGFNGDVVADVITSGVTISDTTDAPGDTITVTIDTEKADAAIPGVTFELGEGTIAGGYTGATVTITADVPKSDAGLTLEYIASQVLSSTVPGTYPVLLTADDLDGLVAADEYETTIEVTIDDPDDTIEMDMFELDEVIDQTGRKDELNPGDDFTAYIAIDAEEDDVDVVYHGMYVEGRLYDADTGEYFGMDETKTFTLGRDSELTKELDFSIPRQLTLNDDKDADRLRVVVDVYAYEQTLDEDTIGHSQIVYI
ncbi:MAG: hypothetical protein QF535_22210 [Anaerolineales bacterium]|nr:hypothetical protein [Anaerolineales bacterium]